MNHQKQDVIPKANAIWPEILINLTNIDESILNHQKEHPCVLCGGKTRFRYRAKPAGLDRPFYCNNCGSKNGMEFFMAYTGMDYSTAINAIGDYIGNIPTDKIEIKQREFEVKSKFPDWYKFDAGVYESIKSNATVELSAWQRVSGLNMLDLLKHEDDAAIPILDDKGNQVDFMMIDIEGNCQTTSGNEIIPGGFHSVFGETEGKRPYIAVSPHVAAHVSIFTQKKVICCYEIENLWEVTKGLSEEPFIIVTNLTEVNEADQLRLNQMTFNTKNNTINRRLYKPYEIMQERGNENE